MYVTLIPFFLAADIIVNDTSKWTFGPEYVYDLRITNTVERPLVPELSTKFGSTYTVKCRPKMPDNLLCRTIYHTNDKICLGYVRDTEYISLDMFEIQFNAERGVESLIIERSDKEHEPTFSAKLFRKIANEFNVIVDRHKIGMPQFIARENSTMGNCATTYVITREERECGKRGTVLKEGDQLMILPLTDAKLGTTLSIEKSRTECINSPQFFDSYMNFFFMGNNSLEMERFMSKIQINSNEFETFTEFDGKVQRLESDVIVESISLKEQIQLELNSIKPAKNELPTILNGILIDLHTNNNIDNVENLVWNL